MSVPPQERPPSWQQGPWPPQPPPPLPAKNNTVKWLLIAVAILLVIAVSVGATLLFTRDNGGGGRTTSSSVVPGDIASANDTEPVAMIAEEPTCEAFIDIYNALADVQSQGWNAERRTLGPASDWTPDQRAHVESVATALRNATDQIVPLARKTPHRVIRELYEQFIAYGRAYADAVPNYTAADGYLAGTNVAIGNTLKGVCNSITYKSHTRSLAIETASKPTSIAAVGNPADPHRFVSSSDSTCATWISNDEKFGAGSGDWQTQDSNISGAQWTPEQRAIQLAALPVLSTLAKDMESTGRQSGNPVLEDFAVLGALYLRAYVGAGDSYTPADSWLSFTGLRINNTVAAACQQAGN